MYAQEIHYFGDNLNVLLRSVQRGEALDTSRRRKQQQQHNNNNHQQQQQQQK